jgi:pimeloyl-ACP methyl ester carboxylesterase
VIRATLPRWLYLHGFASSPDSVKGTFLARHFAARGQPIDRLDLRVPSPERLRLGAMIDVTRAAIGDAHDRAVVFGSSLGGLTAARVAEEDARVSALVLLAPAFRIVDRWRDRNDTRLDLEDAERIDSRNDGWPDVRVPTLIVHGVRDDVVPIDGSRAWARGKPHVRLVEVDDDHELARSLGLIAAESERHLSGYFRSGP